MDDEPARPRPAAARRGDADAVAAHARRVLDEISEADGHAEDH